MEQLLVLRRIFQRHVERLEQILGVFRRPGDQHRELQIELGDASESHHFRRGVGELDGFYTPRLKEIEALLSHVGRVEATGNIYSTKWTKLVANTMTMGPFGLLGMGNKDAAALPGMFELSIALGKESLAVGTALGYRMEPIFGLRADEMVGPGEEILIKAMNTLLGHITRGRTAPIHDHMKGRVSEMAFISGLVARKGKELGIDVTCNAAVAEIDRQINRGEIDMKAENFELLKSMVAKS
mgnify:CR=1 FL=1